MRTFFSFVWIGLIFGLGTVWGQDSANFPKLEVGDEDSEWASFVLDGRLPDDWRTRIATLKGQAQDVLARQGFDEVGRGSPIAGLAICREEERPEFFVNSRSAAKVLEDAFPNANVSSTPFRLIRPARRTGRYTGIHLENGTRGSRRGQNSGTFGALVMDPVSQEYFLLSNSHVLTKWSNVARKDDALYHPKFGRRGAEVIASLESFVELYYNDPTKTNYVDAAIARVDPACFGTERPGSNDTPDTRNNILVVKDNTDTNRTLGKVKCVLGEVMVRYGGEKVAFFRDQLLIENEEPGKNFAEPGDSGSLILARDGGKPIGLLFASNGTHSLASPIKFVERALGVEIVGHDLSTHKSRVCKPGPRPSATRKRDLRVHQCERVTEDTETLYKTLDLF